MMVTNSLFQTYSHVAVQEFGPTLTDVVLSYQNFLQTKNDQRHLLSPQSPISSCHEIQTVSLFWFRCPPNRIHGVEMTHSLFGTITDKL